MQQGGGADLIDVACDPALVRLAIEASGGVPVCVSSVEPEQFPGRGGRRADGGDRQLRRLLPPGPDFDAAEVLELTATRDLLPEVVLSVTVPHVLPMDRGTAGHRSGGGRCRSDPDRGGTSAKPFSAGHLGLIEKAAPTLAAAHSISRAVDVPCSAPGPRR